MKTAAAVAVELPPVKCPTCAAPVPAAHAANVETTYLRCPACGDVWNPVRRTTVSAAPRWTGFSPTFRGR